ncbi:MAG: ribosome maturation factor RimP [Clostridia bacterium]|nr:ribosome maturation factor RimP [Clostridia bacterium]
MANRITDKVSEMILPFLTENGVRIYDIEFVKEGANRVLRLYIDKKDGRVSIDDCETVSRKLSDLLDAGDFIEDAYILEVSSPGIERVLKYDFHFEEAVGEDVEIKLFKAVNGSKNLIGTLVSGSEKGDVTLSISDEELIIKRENISQVKIHFEF